MGSMLFLENIAKYKISQEYSCIYVYIVCFLIMVRVRAF